MQTVLYHSSGSEALYGGSNDPWSTIANGYNNNEADYAMCLILTSTAGWRYSRYIIGSTPLYKSGDAWSDALVGKITKVEMGFITQGALGYTVTNYAFNHIFEYNSSSSILQTMTAAFGPGTYWYDITTNAAAPATWTYSGLMTYAKSYVNFLGYDNPPKFGGSLTGYVYETYIRVTWTPKAGGFFNIF